MRIPLVAATIIAIAGNLPAATAPINLSPKPPANPIPLFAVTGEPALDLVVPFFTDQENDVLTYRLEGLPTGMSFDALHRTIRGTTNKAGASLLTLFADDGQGNTASVKLNLQVNVLPQRQFYRSKGHPRNFVRVYPPHQTVTEPTPAVVFIHGGGWTGGYPETWAIRENLRNAGITCITVTYRMLGHSHQDGVNPPVTGTMDDIRRAFQFVRHNATAWGIDPRRIAVTGASAGACAALQLALGDDQADPTSLDPVARQSTRPLLAAVNDPQTTLDPVQVDAWIPSMIMENPRQDVHYGGHAFGMTRLLTANPPIAEAERMFAGNFYHNRSTFLEFKAWAATASNRTLVEAYSPWYLATADDPAIFMIFNNAPGKTNQPFRAHAPEYGPPLHEKLVGLGVPCELVLPAQKYPAEMVTAGLVKNTPGRTDAHVSDLDYLTSMLLGNHSPVAAVLDNQSIAVGSPWSWTLPAFTDVDEDVLRYSVTGLPSQLVFNPITRTITGTPLATGTHPITVSAHDYRSGTATTAFTLTVTGGVVPPPTPISNCRDMIYTDFSADGVLKTGWEQKNHNTTGWLRSTGTTRNGSQHSYSIEFKAADAYAGLWCKNNAFDTQRYASVSFWIHGGVVGGQDVDVQAVRADGSLKSFRLAPLNKEQWQLITIALADLGAAEVTDLAHLRFVNKGSSSATAFYIDDLSFDVLTQPQTLLYAEGIKSGWTQQNLNCDGHLLNQESRRTGLRSYSIKFLAADAYAGMKSPNTPYNVGAQAALTFWINGGSVGGQRIEIQAVRVGSALPGKLLEPLKAGTWQKVTVYLDELGILGATDLSAIRFVYRSGGATETLYVDDVSFDEAMPETVSGTR